MEEGVFLHLGPLYALRLLAATVTGRIQESRKSGSTIAVRDKFGVPGLSSEEVSYIRLFSSDGILRRSALAGSVDV
jgi:hypothetical protein